MLKAKVLENGKARRIALSGKLDERAGASLQEMRKLADGAERLTFVVKDLDAVNSKGIAYWCDFLAAVTARTSVVLEECPAELFDYANVVAAVTTGAAVTSVFFPIRCPACNTSADVLVSMAAPLPFVGGGAALPCPACAKPAKPAVDPERFFAFQDLEPGA